MEYDDYMNWLQGQQSGLLGSGDAATPATPDATAAPAPSTQALPDPNALYAQMQAQGQSPQYAALAPGVSIDNLNPQAKSVANYVLNKYPDWTITGGSRDPNTNAAVGGAGDSQHLHNNAIDLRPPSGVTPDQKAAFMTDVAQQGARGIGVYPTGSMHVDTRSGPPAVWGSDYHYGSFANEQKGPVLAAGQALRQGTLNQVNPTIAATQAGGSIGTPAGPAAPSPSQAIQGPVQPDPTTTGPTGAATAQTGAVGATGPTKKDDKTAEDAMQKIAKTMISLGALGARGPLHYAPPASGGSPVNKPDVATPERFKGTARLLPHIQVRGLLG